MKFSIITPSRNQLGFLRLCAASVRDQAGVEFEHIIQDACSEPEVGEWAARHPSLRFYSEKDTGMYDAVNRGLRRSDGEICSYLNCDEQYLPGTLARVHEFFERNPQIDIVFGGAIVVNAKGQYICSRRVLLPHLDHTRFNFLATFTCSTFFRRRVLDGEKLYFNPNLRAVGDCEWVLRCLDQRVPMAVLRKHLATFTDTGENVSLQDFVRHEADDLRNETRWVRLRRFYWQWHHRLRKARHGLYFEKPFNYQIYTEESVERRQTFSVLRPRHAWLNRIYSSFEKDAASAKA